MGGEAVYEVAVGVPRVAVLGETTVDGGSPTVGQRPILAALALGGGAVVSTESLIDAVWSGCPPRSAKQSLHNQITRLRRVFGADLIETGATGYRLTAGTDAQLFEQSVAPWLDRPIEPRAIPPLRTGLDAWTGTPYADLVDSHAVEAERARLQTIQVTAYERLAQCRIAAGQFDTAVNELTALLGSDPYRDQPWALLMLALHLDGRRTDALLAFDRLEKFLERELSTAPSPLIGKLREQIAGDEHIDVERWLPVARRRRACSTNRRLVGRCPLTVPS